MTQVGPPIHFLNLEYFFRLLYDASAHADIQLDILAWLSHLWLLVTLLGLLIALIALIVLVQSTLRMRQTEAEDEPRYATMDPVHAEEVTEHHRWAHVQMLIESANESDWRQAILEADIILDDMLTRIGYIGTSVGDKLKQANPTSFHTIRDAWDAHMVRNDIAHQGSAYELTNHIAYRTIKQYENVFIEHHEI